MTFSQIPSGASLFLDANILLYHFANDTRYGAACTALIKEVERRRLFGFTSTHALADVTHRLMTLEAISSLGWPAQGIAARLRKNHSEIAKLTIHEQALSRIPLLNIQVLPVAQAAIVATPALGRRFELLTGDALVVAIMQAQNLSILASNDADFDRVTGIIRYSPI